MMTLFAQTLDAAVRVELNVEVRHGQAAGNLSSKISSLRLCMPHCCNQRADGPRRTFPKCLPRCLLGMLQHLNSQRTNRHQPSVGLCSRIAALLQHPPCERQELSLPAKMNCQTPFAARSAVGPV